MHATNFYFTTCSLGMPQQAPSELPRSLRGAHSLMPQSYIGNVFFIDSALGNLFFVASLQTLFWTRSWRNAGKRNSTRKPTVFWVQCSFDSSQHFWTETCMRWQKNNTKKSKMLTWVHFSYGTCWHFSIGTFVHFSECIFLHLVSGAWKKHGNYGNEKQRTKYSLTLVHTSSGVEL